MPVWASAGLWGLLAASSLLLGAALAFLLPMPRSVTAGIMSFGCGVLISAVAYDLLEDGFQEGGIWPIVAGAIVGSVAYALADCALAISSKETPMGADSLSPSGLFWMESLSLLFLALDCLLEKASASPCLQPSSYRISRKGYRARLECSGPDEASAMCSAFGW